jgi:Na+-transporting NADH:ubiquinone oxidoreductase subunit F
MAVLASVLALIILVAEAYLMDYGEVELTINKDKKLKVKGGQTALSALKEQKVFIPSACGGRATCAYCKVKAVAGFGELLPTEAPLLTKEEIATGVRLACQLKIKTNAAIQIPEEFFSVKEFRASVVEVVDLTYDIKGFTFALRDPMNIEYVAGQYVQFQAPEYGESTESVYRAYSMSSVPNNRDRIELMVRLVPEGICTTYMFNCLKKGDEVVFTGPYGEFYLRDSDRKMVCIAGGSGMAPIRSLLRSMTPEQIAARRPVFFFGARAVKDLFLVDEWRQFERDNPGFKFVPALSQPDPGDEWSGDVGRITDIVVQHLPDMTDCEGYLCGSPGMLNACVQILTDRGVKRERIYYDKFA